MSHTTPEMMLALDKQQQVWSTVRQPGIFRVHVSERQWPLHNLMLQTDRKTRTSAQWTEVNVITLFSEQVSEEENITPWSTDTWAATVGVIE